VVESRNLQAKETRVKMEEFKAFIDLQKHIPLNLKTESKDAYAYYLKKRPRIAEKGEK
jgi:hypothetical protein